VSGWERAVSKLKEMPNMRRHTSLTVATLLFQTVAVAVALADLPTPAPDRRAPSRLVIAFYSIASGPIDSDVKSVESFLRAYETSHDVTLEKTKSAYGMEGDFAYCFALAELGAEDQADLVRAIQSLARALRQVTVEENTPCPGRGE
jgi:hypothetical protein